MEAKVMTQELKQGCTCIYHGGSDNEVKGIYVKTIWIQDKIAVFKPLGSSTIEYVEKKDLERI